MPETDWAGVYASEPLSSLEHCDDSDVAGWITASLPFRGSKVDWARVPGEHQHWPGAELSTVLPLLESHLANGAGAIHIGDNLSPCGVRIGASDLAAVPALLAIPEHHYLVADDRSWVLVITFEGDVDLVELS